MSLLVVGTVAFDSIETPYGSVDKAIGGAATYICWAASYFYKNINLVSVIGEDWPADERQKLESRGVNTEGLQIIKGGKSFYWSGKYHDNMNSRDTLITDLNVLADFNPILPESYKKSKIVMLGNLTPDIQMQVLKQMDRKPDLVLLDTMNFWMDIAMPSLKKVLKKVDILTINDEEARQLSGEHSLVKAAAVIRKMGPKTLVIKKGEHGALLFHKDEVFFAPALPLNEVIDPTGAGDTFAGGFVGYLARSGKKSAVNLKKAMIYGSALASFCVEDFSLTKLQGLDDEMIVDRLQQFKRLVHFTI